MEQDIFIIIFLKSLLLYAIGVLQNLRKSEFLSYFRIFKALFYLVYKVLCFLGYIILCSKGSHLSSFEFATQVCLCSCHSNNTPLFEEFINVFLTPDLLQLQQYCIVAKHLLWVQLPCVLLTCSLPWPNGACLLRGDCPSFCSFHPKRSLASCCSGPSGVQLSPQGLPQIGFYVKCIYIFIL